MTGCELGASADCFNRRIVTCSVSRLLSKTNLCALMDIDKNEDGI